MAFIAWHTNRNLASHIVRRLVRTKRPVSIRLRAVDLPGWDPSQPLPNSGFWSRGTATYALESPAKVRVRLVTRSGEVVERSGTIPTAWLPDPPEARRRKWLARAIVSLYAALGVIAFALPASLMHGSPNLRVRVGALAAVASVSIAWLATHVVLTHRNAHRHPAHAHPHLLRLRHWLLWIALLLVIAAVLAVAWRLGDNGQPRQTTTSWPSAFINALIFVFACAAAVAASTHHHNFVHHAAGPAQSGRKRSADQTSSIET
jgi:hypothetical protein